MSRNKTALKEDKYSDDFKIQTFIFRRGGEGCHEDSAQPTQIFNIEM